ncbi:hypothetical protein PsYK624_172460 [Phanerochaete sordida]|uniref:Uncharacterized protein n=1 Tax=Phanerochaete sordida TaxID=48140 RepID=A0A9P3GT80_9APHY|nr:hypothetical protein PsYK624_172460 [Phanerochaete sordida]
MFCEVGLLFLFKVSDGLLLDLAALITTRCAYQMLIQRINSVEMGLTSRRSGLEKAQLLFICSFLVVWNVELASSGIIRATEIQEAVGWYVPVQQATYITSTLYLWGRSIVVCLWPVDANADNVTLLYKERMILILCMQAAAQVFRIAVSLAVCIISPNSFLANWFVEIVLDGRKIYMRAVLVRLHHTAKVIDYQPSGVLDDWFTSLDEFCTATPLEGYRIYCAFLQRCTENGKALRAQNASGDSGRESTGHEQLPVASPPPADHPKHAIEPSSSSAAAPSGAPLLSAPAATSSTQNESDPLPADDPSVSSALIPLLLPPSSEQAPSPGEASSSTVRPLPPALTVGASDGPISRPAIHNLARKYYKALPGSSDSAAARASTAAPAKTREERVAEQQTRMRAQFEAIDEHTRALDGTKNAFQRFAEEIRRARSEEPTREHPSAIVQRTRARRDARGEGASRESAITL